MVRHINMVCYVHSQAALGLLLATAVQFILEQRVRASYQQSTCAKPPKTA